MKRISITCLLPVLLLVALAACGGAGDIGRVAVGEPSPAFAAPTLGGDTVALSDLQGHVVLVNLWATWCPPCREEMPALQALHQEFEGEGLRVVGVSIDEASAGDDIEAFLASNAITFTILHDADQSVTNVFRTTGVPETFLVGRDGTLLKRWIGMIDPASASVRDPIVAALASGAAE